MHTRKTERTRAQQNAVIGVLPLATLPPNFTNFRTNVRLGLDIAQMFVYYLGKVGKQTFCLG